MKFRKKPVVIEAFQFSGWTDALSRYPRWFTDSNPRGPGGDIFWEKFDEKPPFDCAAIIETLEGYMRAEWGDWIIRGVKGELYPCKSDIFEATYEAVQP